MLNITLLDLNLELTHSDFRNYCLCSGPNVLFSCGKSILFSRSLNKFTIPAAGQSTEDGDGRRIKRPPTLKIIFWSRFN